MQGALVEIVVEHTTRVGVEEILYVCFVCNLGRYLQEFVLERKQYCWQHSRLHRQHGGIAVSVHRSQ